MPIHSVSVASTALPRTRPLPPSVPELAIVDELLRDRGAYLDRIDRGEDLARIARAMILTVVVCGAAFGGAIGAWRGGAQIAVSAVKLPVVLLLTAAICAPVLTALNTVLLGRSDVRRDLAVVLSSLGLAGLVAAALTPLVLMAAGSPTLGYHRMVLVTVACAGLGGAIGLAFFLRTLHRHGGEERWFAGATVLAIFALVGAQTTWTLRPYVGVPGSEVVLLHPIQGSFLDSVVRTAYTAAGMRVHELTTPEHPSEAAEPVTETVP